MYLRHLSKSMTDIAHPSIRDVYTGHQLQATGNTPRTMRSLHLKASHVLSLPISNTHVHAYSAYRSPSVSGVSGVPNASSPTKLVLLPDLHCLLSTIISPQWPVRVQRIAMTTTLLIDNGRGFCLMESSCSVRFVFDTTVYSSYPKSAHERLECSFCWCHRI